MKGNRQFVKISEKQIKALWNTGVDIDIITTSNEDYILKYLFYQNRNETETADNKPSLLLNVSAENYRTTNVL